MNCSGRLNLSKHTFAIIPKDPFVKEDMVNIMFQYRWISSTMPDPSGVNTVIIYGDSAGLNSGTADELGDPKYVNDAINKVLEHLKPCNPNVKLNKYGFSAYSGGGIALYHLFKKTSQLNIKPDVIICSDANYGGKATEPVWTPVAKMGINDAEKKIVFLYTKSLASNFDSTTNTSKAMMKSLNLSLAPISETNLWELKGFKATAGVQKNGLIFLETDLDHGEAGKSVPLLWSTLLGDWNE